MTPAEFKALFPEFSAEADGDVQLFIDRSLAHVDAGIWGDLYSDGVGYWVAHEITAANANALGGVMSADVSSKKIGDVQVTRDAVLLARQSDNPFLRTTYGQKYLYLRKQFGIGALAV